MTTKVTITCQEDSHWPILVAKEDREYNHDNKSWLDCWTEISSVTLRQGNSHEAYVHDSRRLRIEEVPV